MIVIIMVSISVVSCNKGKNNSKDSSGTVMDDEAEVAKEDVKLARIKALDSLLKVMKDESPYPNDMKVLSINLVDSVTNAAVVKEIFTQSKGKGEYSAYYLKPRIIPELKKRALDKSILGHVMTYKLRYRVNDMNVVVKDFTIFLNIKNENMYFTEGKRDRSFVVRQLALSLESFLLQTIK